MRRIRSHSPIQVHVIPPRDLRHLRPVRCLPQSFDLLLWRLILGCWIRELQGRRSTARFCMCPNTRRREARRVLQVFGHGGEIGTRKRMGMLRNGAAERGVE